MNLCTANYSVRRTLSLRMSRISNIDFGNRSIVVRAAIGIGVFNFLAYSGIASVPRVFPPILLINIRMNILILVLTKMSLAVKACMMEVASKACSSACSALLLCTADLSTLPNKLSSPFWLVGSVADGGVNGAGGTYY
jgi:hypothetical protein